MKRIVFASLFAISALVSPFSAATSPEAVAPVLAEVTEHLRQAQSYIKQGTYDLAAAHAEAVIVRDDFTYAIKWENVPKPMYAGAEKALDQGLDNWKTALKNSVTFTKIDDPSKADVVINFKPDVRMKGEPVAGFANWKRVIDQDAKGSISTRFTADLQIRLISPMQRPMPIESVRHEVMHEMGHVLGLEDCDETGFIMGPLDMSKPVSGPRASEVQAVTEIRTQAKKIRLEARAQVLKGSERAKG
jgi:predicted Zn-dependent protease